MARAEFAQSWSRTHFSDVPPEKIATAEVNMPGITWVKTYGFVRSSSTGRSDETAIHDDEPSDA